MGNTRNLGDLLNTDSTIATADVADGGITTAKLADDAVTQAKIGADAVGTTELANDVAINTSAKATVNLASSGNAVDLKLSDTTIGNIGVISDRVYLTAEGSHGVYLDASANNFCPSSTTGTDNNGNIDLGASFAKWKDIHLAGNVVVGTSGKGIDFSAETGDGPSVTSELLDSYEEGHIGTITMSSGGTNVLDSTNSNKYYIKVGRVVHCYFHLVLNGTLSAGTHALTGMPFTSSSSNPAHRGAGVGNAQDASSSFGQDGNYTSITTYENSTNVTLYNPVTYVSEDRINVYFSYVTAS